MDMKHMGYLQDIANKDVDQLRHKESTYKGSWKKRGGVGAFMMLARKWDRIEGIVEGRHYDLFHAEFGMSAEDGTLLAEIRDLRCYLLLVEAEMQSRDDQKKLSTPGTPEDGGHHAKGK